MKKRKTRKISRIERAILILASYIESNPLCEYKVSKEILEILGLEIIADKK